MKVICKLDGAIAGVAFVLRRGQHIGELDDRGIVWLDVVPTNRVLSERPLSRRIGVAASKFSYIEDVATAGHVIPKRAEINEAIKAAQAAAEVRVNPRRAQGRPV